MTELLADQDWEKIELKIISVFKDHQVTCMLVAKL